MSPFFISSCNSDKPAHWWIYAQRIWAANKWYQTYQQSPFSALILLEPPIISAQLDAKYNHFNSMLAAKAKRRRDTWSSKEEANMWIEKQQQKWDPRCVALFQVSYLIFLRFLSLSLSFLLVVFVSNSGCDITATDRFL